MWQLDLRDVKHKGRSNRALFDISLICTPPPPSILRRYGLSIYLTEKNRSVLLAWYTKFNPFSQKRRVYNWCLCFQHMNKAIFCRFFFLIISQNKIFQHSDKTIRQMWRHYTDYFRLCHFDKLIPTSSNIWSWPRESRVPAIRHHIRRNVRLYHGLSENQYPHVIKC